MTTSGESRSRHRKKLVKTLFGEKDTPISTPSEDRDEQPLDMTMVTEELYSLSSGQNTFKDENIKRILGNNYVNGDQEKAKELLGFFRDAVEGLLVPITHAARDISKSKSILAYSKIQGADNLNGVTCYLDTLMFAMFARLENFEPILYKKFESDDKRENLAIFLRLYINMLRSGKLITTDITKCLLDTIFNAGWVPSAGNNKRYEQQDTAELFNFISEALSMPLLTLRVDIAHAGKEVEEDDHKLVNERLLLVPVPGGRSDPPVLLEECLERYFSNSVQVSRQLERSRIIDSSLSGGSMPGNGRTRARTSLDLTGSQPRPVRKFSLETVEIPKFLAAIEQKKRLMEEANSSEEVAFESGSENVDPNSSDPRINLLRTRASTSNSLPPSYDSLYKDRPPPTLPPQKMVALWNAKNEITLPAWMFLQLLPFYSDMRSTQQKSHDKEVLKKEIYKDTNEDSTNDRPNDDIDAPIEEHFANARPVLGICLKRYSWTAEGESMRNDRQVLVPQTIHLPSFVADDTGEGSLFGNFKLILESAIFHRGNSINSGHFVAITAENPGIDYDEEPEIETSSSSGGGSSFFGTKRRNHRRHHTHQHQNSHHHDDYLPPKSPYLSQPPSGRNSESGPRPRRWVFFDDLQPPGEKTKIVDFDEVFARECPYLLFYRMVSADDDDETSSSSRSEIPPIPPLPPLPPFAPLNLSQSLSIESENSDIQQPTLDQFINVPPALASTSTFSTLFSDTSAIPKERGRDKSDKDRSRGRLFRLSRGKSWQGSSSRSHSAPPDKRTQANGGDAIPANDEIARVESINQQSYASSIANLVDPSSSSVFLGIPNPLQLSVSPESRMSSRSLRRRANETSYNVDEKCLVM